MSDTTGTDEYLALQEQIAALRTRIEELEAAQTWQPIKTAPKEVDTLGLTPRILLGFTPDEDGDALASVEGYWRITEYKGVPPCFVSCMDPDTPYLQLQPTHWMPLPKPPKGESDE